MSELIFIRHAETDMAGTFCGHSDPELNDCGRAQFDRLIEQLREHNIQSVYSSDLRRALRSARALAEAFHVKCSICPALREIGFGEWEGLTWQQVERRNAAFSRRWLKEYPDLPAPSGETFRDFETRVLHAVEFLTRMAAGRTVAVVTHAGVIRTVLRKLRGCSEEEAWELTKEYCSLVRYSNSVTSPRREYEVSL